MDSKCKESLLVLNLEVHGRKMLVMFTLIILTLSSQISSCNLIYRFHLKESMDLEKDLENLVLSLELGPCGQMEEMNHMMMEQVENRHTAFILLHLSKLNLKMNGWVSSLEMLTLSLQLSLTN